MAERIYTGRRKSAVARARLRPGSGAWKINDRPLEDFFPVDTLQGLVREPFEVTDTVGRYDVFVRVNGGGVSGQAGAVRLAIARALEGEDEEHRPTLKQAGLLTRDPREVERKKYGLKKARKAPQYSKR